VPRALRTQIEGGIYHVNSRGVRDTHLFIDDACREMFLAILGVVVSRYNWICASYCLLGTHYHLLIETREATIARGMQALGGLFGQWFNVTHGTRGHVFASRYHDVLVNSEAQLYRAARYIALNPVRAGLCTRPGDWKWSSYPALVGAARAPRLLDVDYLLRGLGGTRDQAHRAMRAMVEELPAPEWPP